MATSLSASMAETLSPFDQEKEASQTHSYGLFRRQKSLIDRPESSASRQPRASSTRSKAREMLAKGSQSSRRQIQESDSLAQP